MQLYIFDIGTDEWDSAIAAVLAADLAEARRLVTESTGLSGGALSSVTVMEPGEVYH